MNMFEHVALTVALWVLHALRSPDLQATIARLEDEAIAALEAANSATPPTTGATGTPGPVGDVGATGPLPAKANSMTGVTQ